MVFDPPGYTSEKQRLHVEYFSDFLDDPLSPVTDIDFQLLSRFVEVYSVEYRVHARFTGLRFLMHHYPVISALVGCTLNLMFLSAVVLLSYFRSDTTIVFLNNATNQVPHFLTDSSPRSPRKK